VAGCVAMTLVGEYLCVLWEMRDIPLSACRQEGGGGQRAPWSAGSVAESARIAGSAVSTTAGAACHACRLLALSLPWPPVRAWLAVPRRVSGEAARRAPSPPLSDAPAPVCPIPAASAKLRERKDTSGPRGELLPVTDPDAHSNRSTAAGAAARIRSQAAIASRQTSVQMALAPQSVIQQAREAVIGMTSRRGTPSREPSKLHVTTTTTTTDGP